MHQLAAHERLVVLPPLFCPPRAPPATFSVTAGGGIPRITFLSRHRNHDSFSRSLPVIPRYPQSHLHAHPLRSGDPHPISGASSQGTTRRQSWPASPTQLRGDATAAAAAGWRCGDGVAVEEQWRRGDLVEGGAFVGGAQPEEATGKSRASSSPSPSSSSSRTRPRSCPHIPHASPPTTSLTASGVPITIINTSSRVSFMKA